MTAQHSWDGTRPAIAREFARPEERASRICGYCGRYEVEPVYRDGKTFTAPIGWRTVTDGWCVAAPEQHKGEERAAA